MRLHLLPVLLSQLMVVIRHNKRKLELIFFFLVINYDILYIERLGVNMNYLDIINKYTWEYFKVLEPDFPTWLIPYINTPVMLKQQYISTMCGKNYTKLFNIDYYYYY